MPSERRLHPVSFAFELASHLRQLVLPGLFVLVAGARGSDSWQVYLMLLFVPFALASIARTLVFRYRLDADELVIRSGLIFKQQRHVPYARIQNLDAVQNLFHRAFGVVDVRLETAGGQEPEAHLKVLSIAAFEEVRARVGAAKATEGGEAAAAAPAAAGTTLLRLSARDLVICGLIQGRGLIVIGALFGLLWEAGLVDRLTGSVFGDAVSGRGVARQLLRSMIGQGIPPLDKIGLTVAAFAGLVGVTRVFSVGWALVRLHGFALRRIDSDLRIDFGLLTRVAATIPMRRIQSVTVHEGPIHRWFNRVSVHVDTAGGESGEDVQLQRQWLAPVIGRDRVAALLAELLPSTAIDSVAWQPVEPRGVRRARVEWLVLAVGLSLLLMSILRWWTPLAFALLAVVGEVNARKSVRALGWSLTDAVVLFRSGWLWRRQTAAPFSKIQAVSVRESPFDRRHRMARVAVDTAGSSRARHQIDVPYLSRATAEALASRLATGAAETAFRW